MNIDKTGTFRYDYPQRFAYDWRDVMYYNELWEYDSFSGPDLLCVVRYERKEEAESDVLKYNSRNNLPSAPDYYTKLRFVGLADSYNEEFVMEPEEFWETDAAVTRAMSNPS